MKIIIILSIEFTVLIVFSTTTDQIHCLITLLLN